MSGASKAPLTVAIDVSAVPREPVGAGQYTVELVRALAERTDVALSLVTRRRDTARWSELASDSRSGAISLVPQAPNDLRARLLFGELGLSATVRRFAPAAEVLHCPHYTMPRDSALPVLVTVHDLTFVEHPEWHERAKVPVFRRALRRAARHADAVVLPSAQTAGRFIDRYQPRAHVEVVPHGVDHHRFSPTERSPGEDGSVLGRLGLLRPFVLHLGTIEPRKDLPSLVAAFDRLATKDADLVLVLAGSPGWGSRELDLAVANARHGERVIRLGYIANDEVPALLRTAAVVAYPSLDEGFGLPALEALACGAPLVTTAGSVMAEMAGDTALLVGPHSPEALAEALQEALANGAEVRARRAAGLLRAAQFTWAASAALHLEAFASASLR